MNSPAQTNEDIFLDSFEGDSLRADWKVKNFNEDGLLVEEGSLILVSTGGTSSLVKPTTANRVALPNLSLKGDWDMSAVIFPDFATGADQIAFGLVKDEKNAVYATLWTDYGQNCGTFTVEVSKKAKGEYTAFRNVIMGFDCINNTVSESEFHSSLKRLSEEGGTLTFSKRKRRYFASFTSPVFGGKVFTSDEATVLRAGGVPTMVVSKWKARKDGEVMVMVDEFRISGAP